MNLKTILTVGAVAFGGSFLFGGRKVSNYKNVAANLDFNLKSVKGISLQNGIVKFNVDIEVINPTTTAINVPGNLLLIKNLYFHTPSGIMVGMAHPNISNIELPANGRRLITGVPASVSLQAVGKSFGEVMEIILDPQKLRVGAEIEAFGKSFTINP